MIAHREFVVRQIEGLAGTFLAFELRIARPARGFAPLKEVLEGDSHIPECAFHCALRDLIGPGKLLASDGVELLFQSHRIRLASGFILRFPFRQCPVEHEAGRASSTSKIIRLFRRWMEPDLVRFEHP